MQEVTFSAEALAGYEALGLTLEYREGTGYSTNYFLTTPNGHSYATYTDWVSVQTDFNSGVLSAGSGNWNGDGTQFMMYTEAHPSTYPDVADLWIKYEDQPSADLGLITIGWALALVLLAAFTFACIIAYGVLITHACGFAVQKVQISECEWVVTKPDCSHATFNQCANDGKGAWTSDWSGGGFDWMLIVWIGVGLVGLYIAAKVLPGLLSSGGGGSSRGSTMMVPSGYSWTTS